MIALGIFVLAFIIIAMTKIEEPEQAPVEVSLIKGAMSTVTLLLVLWPSSFTWASK